MKPRTTTLPDPLYGGVHYGIYAPQAKMRRAVMALLPPAYRDEVDVDEYKAGTAHVMFKRGYAMVTLITINADSNIAPLNVLAHEVFHASTQTLDHAGLRLSDDSQEAFAYHFSWLFEGLRKGLRV